MSVRPDTIERPMRFRERPVDELVLVIHGVGDPEPGETLSVFARSVAEAQHPLSEQEEILWLSDENGDSTERDVATFPCHTRYLLAGGNRARLAEVYWADLSRVKRGWIGVVSGLVSIIFGLRYIAFVAGEQAGIAAKGLQALGVICSRLVHGPVLAVNFVLAMLLLTISATEAMWPGSSQNPRWASGLMIGCVLICLTASALGYRFSIRNLSGRFWFWVMLSALFLNAMMLAGVFLGKPFPLVTYCNVMVMMLGTQWVTLVVVLLTMTALWAIALFEKGNDRRGIHLAFIVPAIAVGIWGQMLPLIWITGSTTVMGVLSPGEVNSEQLAKVFYKGLQEDAVGGRSGMAAPGAQRGSSARTLESFLSADDKSAPVRYQMKRMFSNAVPLMGIQFLGSIVLGVAMIVQFARFMRWAERTTVEDFQRGRRGPRLIVNEAVQALVLACAVIVIFLILYVTGMEYLGFDTEKDPVCQMMREANKYAIGFIFPIAGVAVISIRYLRPALDIVLDVINHFHFRATTLDDRLSMRNEDFDLDEVTFNGGEFYFYRRDAIHRRLKRILDYYRVNLPGNPSLTLVGHSQGTMVAIEVLNDEELDWLKTKFRHVNIVTMGSPFGHIYQHYFPRFYPSLDDAKWSLLVSRVSKWLNIFRIDDYVGTAIDFSKVAAMNTGKMYENQAVERLGHLNYWTDRQVLKLIREHDMCRSLPVLEIEPETGSITKAA